MVSAIATHERGLMLQLNQAQQEFTIMAIDPGLNNTGVAIYRMQTEPVKVLSITAMTLKAERLIDDSGLDDEDFMERLHKRYAMGRALKRLLETYDPCIFVSESPFFDRRKPGSFAVLTEVLSELFDTVIAYNPLIRTSVVEPLLVKKVLGVAGQKGKEVVKEAMEKERYIIERLSVPLDHLDEHGIDAVGVGYTWLKLKSKYAIDWENN